MHLLLLLLAAATFSFAATLPELIQTALENNPELKRLERQVAAGEAEAELAGKYDNPRLSAAVNDLLLSDPNNRGLEPMQAQSIQLSQALPVSGRLDASRQVALGNLRVQELLLQKEQARITYAVKEAALTITRLHRDLDILERFEKTVAKLVEIHTLYNLESKSHYGATLKSGIIQAKLQLKRQTILSSLDAAQNHLEALLASPIPSVEIPYAMGEEKLMSVETVLATNPDLLIARQGVAVGSESLELARTLTTPDITVSAGYYQRDAFDDYVAFSLSLPLQVYGREESAVRRAMEKKSAAEARLEALRNDLTATLRSRHTSLKSARKEYAILQSVLKAQEDVMQSLTGGIQSEQSSLKEGYELVTEMFESEFELNERIFRYNRDAAFIAMLKGERQ